MRINVASSGGRFHLLDLARELDKHGHTVRFYSYVPTKRAVKFGLRKECSKSYFYVALPFLCLLKITHYASWSLYLFHRFFDFYTALIMEPCDIFIGHSPMHVYALKYARKKYGAKILLERGTSHVLTQIKALQQNPRNEGKDVMPNIFLKRDLEGYKIADYIIIASEHVFKSFVENGVPEQKLFKNPYGVNLQKFQPTMLENNEHTFDVLMVGQWCHRKGCDLLYQACKDMNLRFLHVGPIVDLSFEQTDKIYHHDAVEEFRLQEFYKLSRIFVLPSREEGLAMVQSQAMLCGLPLVCSQYSGGKDLKDMLPIENQKYIILMEEVSLSELKKCITIALKVSYHQKGIRNYSGDIEQMLSWEAYGNRYNDFICSLD